MNIEMGKKYQTRDGRAVRILATDRAFSEWPVVGLITNRTGNEVMQAWDLNGFQRYYEEVSLVPVPAKHRVWCVINPGGPMSRFATLYATEDEANENRGSGFVAPVEDS